jgi:hypothetical protein
LIKSPHNLATRVASGEVKLTVILSPSTTKGRAPDCHIDVLPHPPGSDYVEIGQLSVIAAAFLLVGHWYGDRTWYRRRIVVPASVAIALTALVWTIQRTLG